MKFLSPHFKSLHVNGAGTFTDGELTVLNDDERALAKVRAIAADYQIVEQPDGQHDSTDDDSADDVTEPTPPGELKGAALEAALRDAGLPLTGTADEKRVRLATHLEQNTADTPGDEQTGSEQLAVDGPAAAVIDGTAPATGTTPDVLTSGTVPNPS